MKIVGQGFKLEAFKAYLNTVQFKDWKPSLVVIHHCSAPSLSQRPVGFIKQHMENLRYYYGEELGWSAGPHIFTDEDEAWVFSPLTARGVHAVSFNAKGLGIEMLGNYDVEDPMSGRGLKVVQMTAVVTKLLLNKLGLTTDAIRFHRDDPKTSKSCPGKKVNKVWFVKQVEAAVV